MSIKILIFSCLLCMSTILYAQYGETIRSDRPGQAITPFTTGKGIFQNQTGFQHDNISYPGDLEINSMSLGTTFRMGASETFEINGTIAVYQDQLSLNEYENENSGISQAEIGIRKHFLDGEGFSPSMAIQASFILPSDFQDDLSSRLIFTSVQNITDATALTTNLGVDFYNGYHDVLGTYVINLSQSIGERWSVFAEHYGFFDDLNWAGRFDGGLAYLLNDNWQLDLYGGGGDLGADQDTYFVSLGFSWRTGRK